MIPFYVLGVLTALWAVLLSALGIARHRFPGTDGATRIVMAISGVLVLATVVAGIVGGIVEEAHEEAAEAAEEEAHASEEAPAEEPLPGAETIELSADPSGDLAFDVDTLEAAPGPVTLAMSNPSSIAHDVSLEGDGVDEQGEVVEQGGTSTVSAEVQPGEYTYYCSVAGHREGGMEGTLVVGGAEGGGAEGGGSEGGGAEGGASQGGGGQGAAGRQGGADQ